MENKQDYLLKPYWLLLKPYWDISDIMAYFSVGETKASEIKANVKKRYGNIPCEAEQERAKVSADKVISVMGGHGRLEELQIYKTFMEATNGKNNYER